jgi:hypothetical protein
MGVTEHAWSVHGGGHHLHSEAGDSLGHGACPAGSCWSAYDLLGRVGTGGFGIVHRARSRATDELVAIKEIPRSAIAERELHVHRAAAASTGVVVRIPDFYVEPAAVFLVLELCRGPDLAHILETRGCVSELEAQNVMRQLCRAIDHLHRRRIVHRDIKPANLVFLDPLPSCRAPIDRATVKLIDMGLSRVLPVASRPTGRVNEKAAEWKESLPSLDEEKGTPLLSGNRVAVGLRGRILAARQATHSRGVPGDQDGGMRGRGDSVHAQHAGGVKPARVCGEAESGCGAEDVDRVALAEARAAAALVAVAGGERAHAAHMLAELEISHEPIDVRARPSAARPRPLGGRPIPLPASANPPRFPTTPRALPWPPRS